MKVILLAHIKGLGQKGEVKEVSEGYFHNFLAPRRMAAPATTSQVNHIHAQQAKAVERLENIKESALAVKSKLEGKEVTLTEKVSESGKLYAALHAADVARALKTQLQVDVPEKSLHVDPIKSAGDFLVRATLYKDVEATFTLHVRAA